MNFGITSIPAFYVYKNGELLENFVGANKEKLLGVVQRLKSELGDEVINTAPSQAAADPQMLAAGASILE